MESKLKREFIKDMKSSYMVLKGDGREQNYKNKMLSQYSIPGLLGIDIKSINNMELYYYDITNLKTLEEAYGTRVFHFHDMKDLLDRIFDAIDNSREYFLEQDDFILHPEGLYMKENTDSLKLCYYPGYRESIVGQFSLLFEYIMNKADYKEESAVLLIYALYKESREKNTTLYRLRDILKEATPKEIKVRKLTVSQEINIRTLDNVQTGQTGQKALVSPLVNKPVAVEENYTNTNSQEEYEKQEEVSYYETNSFVLLGAIVAGALGFLFVLFKTGVLSDEMGHPDIIKVTAGLAIVVCLSGYALTKVFDPKKKSTRLVTRIAYDNTAEESERTDIEIESDKQNEENREVIPFIQEENSVTSILSEAEDKTEILFVQPSLPSHYLIAKSSNNPAEIAMKNFPYYVGKDKTRNQLVLNEGSVSRLHAVITIRDKVVFLTDLGSTNGTYVNGQRIEKNQPVMIDNSDELAFSREIYLFKTKEFEVAN